MIRMLAGWFGETAPVEQFLANSNSPLLPAQAFSRIYTGQVYNLLEGSKDSLTCPSNLYNASRRPWLSDTVSHTKADMLLMHVPTSNGHIFAVIRWILGLFCAVATLERKETSSILYNEPVKTHYIFI